MAIFEDVPIKWDGKEYTIRGNEVLRLVAKIEELFTMGELHDCLMLGRVPFAKLAMAYSVILRHVGLTNITADEVYDKMFKDGGQELRSRGIQALVTLQTLMIPPEHLKEAAGQAPGKGSAAIAGPAAASSPSSTS